MRTPIRNTPHPPSNYIHTNTTRQERNKARKEKDELREQLSIHGPVRTRFEELILAVRRLIAGFGDYGINIADSTT